MALWHRAVADKSCRLSVLYRRSYSPLGCGAGTPLASRGGGWPVSKAPEEPCGVLLRDGVQYVALRFFAAPVQARTKEDPKAMQGHRLNEAITARFIRLVTDEGHAVVSRDEALDRARGLNLDLVEVQRTAKPPVCKIMDYHKERFRKETMEKERAKSKSETTVRKGDFKEVRLKGKIEQKDIEVKAETIKGLIERGYRVKCMALPSKQRGTEECDLGALLSRLTDLIEDVIIVESGPFVEKQQAYVVVRHVKFGSKKNSRKKASKAIETTSETDRAASTAPIAFNSVTSDLDAVEPTDSNEETEDEVLSNPEDDVQDFPDSSTTSTLMYESGAKRNVIGSGLTGKLNSLGVAVSHMTERSPASRLVNNSVKANLGSERDQIGRHGPPLPGVSQSEFLSEGNNRYRRRTEMKFRPDQMRSTGGSVMKEVKITPERSGFSFFDESNKFHRSPGIPNSRGVEQQRSRQGNVLQPSPAYENQKRNPLDSKQGKTPPNDSSPPSSYGLFSSPKPSRYGDQRVADVNWDKDRSPVSSNENVPNTPKSEVGSMGENNDKTKQGGWGIFSRPISNPSQDKSSGQR